MTIEEEYRRLKEIYDMPNSDEKFQKLIRLADDGSVSAQKTVAQGLIDADKDKALHYYRLAADGGDKDSQFKIFSILAEDGNYRLNESSEAFRYLVRSANQRYEPAVVFISVAYAGLNNFGSGTAAVIDIRTNPRKSLDYIKKLDGKTDHSEIQQTLDIVKKHISSKYPSIYNEYYGSSIYNTTDDYSDYSASEEQNSSGSGCGIWLLLVAPFLLFAVNGFVSSIVGIIVGIVAVNKGKKVSGIIAIVVYSFILFASFMAATGH